MELRCTVAVSKAVATDPAVDPLVFQQHALVLEGFAAQRTHKRSSVQVGAQVHLQVAPLRQRLTAHVTLNRSVALPTVTATDGARAGDNRCAGVWKLCGM